MTVTKDNMEPRTCTGWGVKAANEPWEQMEVTLPAVDDDMVEVKIVASGICASDLDACSGAYGSF